MSVIVVSEGPSAAGKTTWAESFPARHRIAETGRLEAPRELPDFEHAAFWNDVNCDRWSEAVDVESSTGLAVCDTDPLKLHYDYCLARVGAAPWSRFDLGAAAAAVAIEEHRLGMADLVLVHIPDDDTLTRQRQSDQTRQRRNFELHRSLASPLRDWYSTLDHLDPGRVCWELPATLPRSARRDHFDGELFDAWMNELPGVRDRP